MSLLAPVGDDLGAYIETLTAWARSGDDTLIAHAEPVSVASGDDEALLSLVRARRPVASEQALVLVLADQRRAQWLVTVGATPSAGLARAWREPQVVLAWQACFDALAIDAIERGPDGPTSVSATPQTVMSEEPSSLAADYAARRVLLSPHTVVVAPLLRELLAAVWPVDARAWLVHGLEDED